MGTVATPDPQLIDVIVNRLKAQGIFDEFRRDFLADVDTKVKKKNYPSSP